MNKYNNKEQIKKELNTDDLKNLSKDKVEKFIYLIPNTNKEVASTIINEYGNFKDLSVQMITCYNDIFNNALISNDKSQLATISGYKKILSQLDKIISKEGITFDEKKWCIDKEIEVANMISVKDKENKTFLKDLLKDYGWFALSLITIGFAFLGGKSTKRV